MEQNRYSGMYSLFLYPNGKVGDRDWIEGKVVIGLDICALPNGVHAVKLKWKIKILELKKEKSWKTTFRYDKFRSEEFKSLKKEIIFCDKKDLKSLRKMHIAVTVDILECHSDSKGTVIPHVQYKPSANDQNKDDEKRMEKVRCVLNL